MDQLISKITSLSYELFGIFLPGLIFILFFVWTWWTLDTLATSVSFGYLHTLAFPNTHEGLLNVELRFGVVAFIAVTSYFVGHLTFWLSRLGDTKELTYEVLKLSRWQKFKIGFHRIFSCLCFFIPKSKDSYHPALKGLLPLGCKFLELPEDLSNWRNFYPIAKCRLSKDLANSLVSTYQNKYTLHRSLCVVAIVWFWVSILILISSCFLGDGAHRPRYAPLVLTCIGCLTIMWGFSGSYLYNWRMFGDTILTEIFMLSKIRRSSKPEGEKKSEA